MEADMPRLPVYAHRVQFFIQGLRRKVPVMAGLIRRLSPEYKPFPFGYVLMRV
jgi:hypothetical protein